MNMSGALRRVVTIAAALVGASGMLVFALSSPAAADTTTFTSGAVGLSGTTPTFDESGPWTMAWSYDCFGGQDAFVVTVNEPAADDAVDLGTSSNGAAASGTEYYYDAGSFSLEVTSTCGWSITVAPSTAGTLATPASFSSAQSGQSANPQEFTAGGPWTIDWAYTCASGKSGNFAVDITEPAGDTATDNGPDSQGTSGNGSDTYNDTGTFNLAVLSQCDWTISITSGSQAQAPAPSGQHGYWLAGADGGVFSFGSAQFYGSAAPYHPAFPVVGITPTPDREGYWLVASDGGVFAFGDAQFYGSVPQLGIASVDSPNPHRLNGPIVGMVPSSDGKGYFLVGADGGIFAFGDAKFEGSCDSIGGCSSGIASVVTDATGNGYWVVTNTGTVYAFGDASNYGSVTAEQYQAAETAYGQVDSAVRTPSGNGYWILFSNGQIYTFGDANYFGSPFGQVTFSDPASSIIATSDGKGYWVITYKGAVYPFGDAPSDGGLTGTSLAGPIVAASGW
jgi:hypothetical protein